MKYLESFFFKKKLTQNELEDIEDIFTSYVEEREISWKGNNIQAIYKGGRETLSGSKPYKLTVYKFIQEGNKLTIEMWSPNTTTVTQIFDRFQKRILKFGYKAKLLKGVDAAYVSDSEPRIQSTGWEVLKNEIIVSK